MLQKLGVLPQSAKRSTPAEAVHPIQTKSAPILPTFGMVCPERTFVTFWWKHITMYVGTDRLPSIDVWKEYCEYVCSNPHPQDGLRCTIYPGTAELTAAHRKLVADALPAHSKLIVVSTDAIQTMVVGIFMRIFRQNYHMVSPKDAHRIQRLLGISDEEERVRRALLERCLTMLENKSSL